MFYSNSNIDTQEEFEKRKREAERLAEAEGVDIVCDRYDHGDWLAKVASGLEDEPEKGKRCEKCYAYNLAKAAKYAAGHGFDAYTTSLTVSPHDFKKRGGFAESLRRSSELGLYRQNYCGCEFSRRGNP